MSHKGCFQAQGTPPLPIGRPHSCMARSLAMATSLPKQPLSQAPDPALRAGSGVGACMSLLLPGVVMVIVGTHTGRPTPPGEGATAMPSGLEPLTRIRFELGIVF